MILQATDIWNYAGNQLHDLCDHVAVSYPEGRSLVHDELTFEALTGFIDYYAYMMLGYDFDSFTELGGAIILRRRRMWYLAQSSNAIAKEVIKQPAEPIYFGGRYDEFKLRYLRRAYYTYHREALTALPKPKPS